MVACCTVAVSLTAQTVKTIGVGQDAPYTDHVALLDDSRDMDLMVKFVFNEAENQLTVSLISYRSLFVFREDTRYKMAVNSPTNQQFVTLPNDVMDRLRQHATFEQWGIRGEHETTVRFVTSWATTEEDVDAFIALL